MRVEHNPTLARQNFAQIEARRAPDAEPVPGGNWGAAFRQENLMANFALHLAEPTFEDDPRFDFEKAATESKAYRVKPQAFYTAQSEAEFKVIENRVMREQADRDALAASGAFGMGLAMVAAIADPTTLIPGGAIYRGARFASALRSSVSVGAAAAGATAVQEAGLHASQELRTTQESLVAVGGAAILGGVLGAAVGSVSRPQLNRLAADMAREPGSSTIRELDIPSPVGAQVNPDADYTGLTKPTGLAPSFGLGESVAWLNPVARTLRSSNQAARSFVTSLSTGGLRVTGDMPNVGGDVESLAKQYESFYYRALKKRAEMIGGTALTRTRNVSEFNEEVGKALRRGAEHSDPQVAEYAAFVRDEVYNLMLQEGRRVGIEEFRSVSDDFVHKYLNRKVRGGLVQKDRLAFEEILNEHFKEAITRDWSSRIARTEARAEGDLEEASLLELEPADADAARAQVEAEIARLPEEFDNEIRELANEIRALRAEARGQRTDEAKAARAEARRLEKENAERLKPFRTAENKLKRRFAILDKGRAGLAKTQARALRQIEELEADSAAARQRLVGRAERVLRNLERYTDERLGSELEKLETQVEKQFDVLAREESRIAELEDVPEDFLELEVSDTRPTDRISRLRQQQEAREAKLDELLTRLQRAQDNLDNRDLSRSAVRSVLEDSIARTERANINRARRVEALRARAAAADPEIATARAREIRGTVDARMQALLERAARDNIKLARDESDTLIPDVEAHSRDLAVDYTEKQLGDSTGVPVWAMMKERGPELARYLHIDETRTWSNGRKFEEFLENDIEVLMRSYLRTVGVDIELQRKFGTVNPLDKDSAIMRAMDEEYREALARAREATDPAKETARIEAEHKQDLIDLRAIVERLRHVHGIPRNPEGYAHRSARVALNLNTTRFMGKVVLSSLPDMAYIVMRHGLLRTFRDGFAPFVTNLKNFKMNAEEVRLAGTALDPVLHGRASAIADIFDDVRHGTKFERGLQYAANNMGIVAGFDYWTAAMKQVTGNIVITKMMKDLELVATGARGAEAAAERFARAGIDSRLAQDIWTEVTQRGGGDLVNGVWLPNTEDWGKSATSTAERNRAWDARRAFRAALVREIDDVVVTPGPERPIWTTGSDLGRLVGQFRSFTFSSTQKVLVAGAQQVRSGDMAPLIGSVISLALGALSYYTWAMATSERARTEMQNAGLDKWADEAIARSGLMGPLSEIQRVAEEIPATSPYATLSGRALTRSPYNRPSDTILGPTASGIASVNEFIQGDMREAVNLAPYNNVLWLADAINRLEERVLP